MFTNPTYRQNMSLGLASGFPELPLFSKHNRHGLNRKPVYDYNQKYLKTTPLR